MHKSLGLLALPNQVIFPGLQTQIRTEDASDIKLLLDLRSSVRPAFAVFPVRAEKPLSEKADKTNERRNEATELHEIGVLCNLIELKKSNNKYVATVEPKTRVKLEKMSSTTPYMRGNVIELRDEVLPGEDEEIERLLTELKQRGTEMLSQRFNMRGIDQFFERFNSHSLPDILASLVAPSRSNSNAQSSIRQNELKCRLEILDSIHVKTRIEKTIALVNNHIEQLKITDEIKSQVKSKVDKSQREFLLRQQLKTIKEELGEQEKEQHLLKKLEELNLPEHVRKIALSEYERLQDINQSSPEYSSIKTYLQWIVELPWSLSTAKPVNLNDAEAQLDADHYGLDKVKQRVLEFISVLAFKRSTRGPIICFVGPPGVGKTSIGRSIAQALGRKYDRIALGGLHDEADIRGHRRTYVASMPGRIIQSLKRAGSNDPVLVLDEIDKLGRDHRGDPAAALLEVLDPEQNSSFTDHYLNLPFDLSNVLFIATANQTDTIPQALLDRMELIPIAGYTVDEKLAIARTHLVPKQLTASGLDADHLTFTDDVLLLLIASYTREAGLRNLERKIASLCRGHVLHLSKAGVQPPHIPKTKLDVATAKTILGPERYRDDGLLRAGIAGIATGLAWTAAGGKLMYIEAIRMPGKGELKLTGQLGDVMKESAAIGLSWLKRNSAKLGVTGPVLVNEDIHIHFPAGAVPKDGPSAGVAIITALASLLTGRCVRSDVAMTGEATLTGLVLPVGGIKEKVLAAHQGGIKHVFLPHRNEPDLEELPPRVRSEISFHMARTVEQVLSYVLLTPAESGVSEKITYSSL
jgi:ATP-dependent Lon protease